MASDPGRRIDSLTKVFESQRALARMLDQGAEVQEALVPRLQEPFGDAQKFGEDQLAFARNVQHLAREVLEVPRAFAEDMLRGAETWRELLESLRRELPETLEGGLGLAWAAIDQHAQHDQRVLLEILNNQKEIQEQCERIEEALQRIEDSLSKDR